MIINIFACISVVGFAQFSAHSVFFILHDHHSMAYLSKVLYAMSMLRFLTCYALDPSVLQVDLVFPRNNTVYKPAAVFPIVFAIHNFSKLWKYRPYLYWELSSWDTGKNWPINLAGDGIIGYDSIMKPKDPGPSPPDLYLAVNSSYMLKQETWKFPPSSMAGPIYFIRYFLGLDKN